MNQLRSDATLIQKGILSSPSSEEWPTKVTQPQN